MANAATPMAAQSGYQNDEPETLMNRSIRQSFPTYVVAPALLVAGVIATATAIAADKSFDVPAWGEARSATVRYADLDLASAAGAQRLQRRIAFAIDQVCALPHAEQLSQRARVAACRADARSQADARAAQLLSRANAAVVRRD